MESANKNVLYLGLEPPPTLNALHYPIIKIVPRPFETKEIQITLRDIPKYTHLIFTSKSTVPIFFEYMFLCGFTLEHLHGKSFIAVGQATANVMKKHGIQATIIPSEETAEGIIRELRGLPLSQAHFFWPHSTLSRPVLTDFFEKHSICYTECLLYDTQPQVPSVPIPDFNQIEEIIFTSPSTINAFMEIFGELPQGKKLTAIGPITKHHLSKASFQERHSH